MDTNNKYDSKYENCWIKYLVVLDKCIPSGTESIDNDKLEVCYQIFKKNFQQCVGVKEVNQISNPLYFNKIVK